MLQKELAKRLKARYDTKMDGSGWLEVSSDGIPLCRIKYNGQFLSNADQNLSDEYRSKIADIQDEISTVREYVGLYEHAPQMNAADVSDYRQLAAFGDTVLAATYSEKNGFMFCTWNRMQTATRCSGEIILRTMNMSRKPLPCVPVSSAKIVCSVRIESARLNQVKNRPSFSLLWGKKCGFYAKSRKKQFKNRQVYAII